MFQESEAIVVPRELFQESGFSLISNKYTLLQKYLLSSHQPSPSVVSKVLDHFGITEAAHAEEADSYLEKTAVIHLARVRWSSEMFSL